VDIFDKIQKNKGPLGQYMKKAHGYFTFPKLEGEIGPRMKFRGKDILNWSLNNYLGLANHPEVRKADATSVKELVEACKDATHIYGAFNAYEYSDAGWERDFPYYAKALGETSKKTNAKIIMIENLYSYDDLKGKKEITEESPQNPPTFKGRIRKVIVEMVELSMPDKNLLRVVKGSDFYGPYALNGMLGKRFFEKFFKKNTAEILPLGNNKHSFTYSKDFAKEAVMVSLMDDAPRFVHVPNSEPIGYEDLINMVIKLSGKKIKTSKVPALFYYLMKYFSPEVKSLQELKYQWDHEYIVSSKIKNNFKPTNLEQGIKETIDWFEGFMSNVS